MILHTTDAGLRVKIINTAFGHRETNDGESYGYYRGPGPHEEWVEVDTDFVEAMANDLLSLIHTHTDAVLERVEKEVIGGTTGINPNNKDFYEGYKLAQDEARTALATIRGEETTR